MINGIGIVRNHWVNKFLIHKNKIYIYKYVLNIVHVFVFKCDIDDMKSNERAGNMSLPAR